VIGGKREKKGKEAKKQGKGRRPPKQRLVGSTTVARAVARGSWRISEKATTAKSTLFEQQQVLKLEEGKRNGYRSHGNLLTIHGCSKP
jgi:hypothetical protein